MAVGRLGWFADGFQHKERVVGGGVPEAGFDLLEAGGSGQFGALVVNVRASGVAFEAYVEEQAYGEDEQGRDNKEHCRQDEGWFQGVLGHGFGTVKAYVQLGPDDRSG